MSLRQCWWGFKRRFNDYMFPHFSAESAEAVKLYAEDAYTRCVAWFGQPLDPHKPYSVQQATGDNSLCSRFLGEYYLIIAKDATSREQLCFHIAHEMYHRVTANRRGLAREMWIQEMMASLSSHWFLCHHGFTEYAESVKEWWLEMPGEADVSLLRASRRRLGLDLILRGGPIYSTEFVTSVGRIGYALNRLLDADDLRRIIKAATLEEWIASLPLERQYGVRRVMEMSTVGGAVPEDERNLDRLFDALEAKGDSKIPVAEFKQIVQLQPTNGIAFFYLGYAYDGAGEHDAALNAYARAIELGFTGNWIFYNIGIVYWQMGNFSHAVEWFQRAVEQKPEWAKPCYHLGCSLNNLGNIEGARQAWEKVLTLNDEMYAQAARQALQENPSPADTKCG